MIFVNERPSGSLMVNACTIVTARGITQYTLDGVEYFTIEARDIPAGYSEVDITMNDTDCTMIAGHLAFALSSNVPGGQLDTLSPSAHWFVVEKQEVVDKKK